MAKKLKVFLLGITSVLMMSLIFTFKAIYSESNSRMDIDTDNEIYYNAETTLMDFLGMEEEGSCFLTEDSDEGSAEDAFGYDTGSVRLTQRVTVVNSEGNVLPIRGSFTKVQDVYYPGTYEVRFGNYSILTDKVTVYVDVDIPKGDTVYIHTGSKEKGYKKYETVIVDEMGRISFETYIIQSYTISAMDIENAQEVLADVISD